MRTSIARLATLLVALCMLARTEARAEPEELTLPEDYQSLLRPQFYDLDGIAKRRFLRVLVVHSKLFYFVDEGRQQGLTYERLQAFEQFLNRKLNTGALKINVVPIVVSRDQLLSALAKGHGDIAATGINVTRSRRARVDFSDPFVDDVREIVVTGPSAPPVADLDDLAGNTVWVRRSSAYFEHLTRLNESFKRAGRTPIHLEAADENLEDEDLIEMVAAGVLPMTVTDRYLADFWSQVFEHAKPRPDLLIHDEGHLAWALRKKTPKLAALVNEFVRTHRAGTLAGNVLLFKYLKGTKWVRNAIAHEEVSKLEPMLDLFQAYADRFSFDWLMVAAQAYQESGLDQSKRSHVGAIGVMQVTPQTASDKRVNVRDIHRLEQNIHADQYLRLLADDYFSDPKIDHRNRMLFCFAAYNAGPARVQSLRSEAERLGLDPNKWFRNVEVVASRRVGRETVQYVSNIYKYYLAYQLVQVRGDLKHAARKKLRK